MHTYIYTHRGGCPISKGLLPCHSFTSFCAALTASLFWRYVMCHQHKLIEKWSHNLDETYQIVQRNVHTYVYYVDVLCIYTYIHMYICIYMYIYNIYIYIYVYIYIYIYMVICLYMYIYTNIRVHVCMYILYLHE